MSDAIPFMDAEQDLQDLLEDLAITAPEGATDPLVPVPVHDHVPEAIQPPCVMLQPGEDWLATDEVASTFNPEEFIATVEAWAVVDLVSNQAAAHELRDLLAGIVHAVSPSAWWIKSIGQPGPIHTSEWMQHGVRIVLARYVTA